MKKTAKYEKKKTCRTRFSESKVGYGRVWNNSTLCNECGKLPIADERSECDI